MANSMSSGRPSPSLSGVVLGENTGGQRTVRTTSLLEHGFQIYEWKAALFPPTSIDDMSPNNPFIETLSTIPVAPGVRVNSIVAVKGEGPPYDDGDDGVVQYRSAHLEGVESELVVHSEHSVQDHPVAIEEIRRILLEHAGARHP